MHKYIHVCAKMKASLHNLKHYLDRQAAWSALCCTSMLPSIQYIHTNMDQQCCSICCWRQMQPICSPYWSVAPLRNFFKTTTFSLSGDSIAIFIRRLCHFLCLTAIYCLALLNNKLCIEVRNASQVLCNLFWRSMPPDPP